MVTNKLNLIYNRLAYIFFHDENLNLKEAERKAFQKTRNLVGIILFFIVILLIHILNKITFNFSSDWLISFLIMASVTITFLIYSEKRMKPKLILVEDITLLDGQKLKQYKKKYKWLALFVFIYSAGIFTLIRLSTIYLF